MPKLRNGGNDLEKFAQWVGRKCRNHNPLEELAMTKRPAAAMYKAGSKGDVFVDATDKSQVIYEAGGRAFVMKIEEVPLEEARQKRRVAVGT